MLDITDIILTSLLNRKGKYFLPMIEVDGIILFIAKPHRMPEALATPFTAVAAGRKRGKRKKKKKKNTTHQHLFSTSKRQI